MRNVTTLAIFICTAALSSFVSAQGPVRDGRWEVSMEMDMPGMPMKMPAIKTTQCVTKEQADDPNQSLPKGSPDKNSDCKVTDHKMVGNKVTWTMECKGESAMKGQGEITYGTNAYDGWMKMTTEDGQMTMKYTAKRLGDCTK
jgi:hypothetical protein